jgi:hypothetical protein
MSNIVELKTRPVIINEKTIELLEQWLEMAKEGFIQNVALAGVTDDFASLTQWSESDNVQTLLGAINILNYKLMKSVLD